MRYFEEFKALVECRIAGRDRREFGFEYELIAAKPLTRKDLDGVRNTLPSLGFSEKNGQIICDEGMYITFEPGGQMEFSSPPLGVDEIDKFDTLLRIIEITIRGVRKATSVNYLPTPYIQGRGTAPMLLEAKRYHDLHDLLGKMGDRGREMMKGTAAVHLHFSIMSFDELLRMWAFMCALSRENGFAMGEQRRDIWDRTDTSRCGLRCTRSEEIFTSCILFEKLISFAMEALELQSGIPFGNIRPHPSFDEFLVHFTTIFTDVRLNTKGMTLELRTLDARPLHMFRGTWITFLQMVQRVMEPVE